MEKHLQELRHHLTNAEDCLNTLYMLGYDVDDQITAIEYIDQCTLKVCRTQSGTSMKEEKEA